MIKSLHNTDQNTTQSNVKDVVFFGDDLFVLLSKASSEREGWMKSTKAMQVAGGCVVQVTTQQRNEDGSYSLAEALSYVPGVEVAVTEAGADGKPAARKLVPIGQAQDSF
jgi:hypothetical protein